jgi:nucleoside-diphosphate-sugar epimerase
LLGEQVGIVFRSRRDWDKVVKRRASIGKARKILRYEPRIDIRTGLQKTYEWISGNKSKIEQVARF